VVYYPGNSEARISVRWGGQAGDCGQMKRAWNFFLKFNLNANPDTAITLSFLDHSVLILSLFDDETGLL
jgi:hypothetical protein